VNKLNFPTETQYTDESFKKGDSILYNAHITPMLEGGMSNTPMNPEVTVNSGEADPANTGRVETVSAYNYPNRIFKVLNGLGSYTFLPFRCSPTNLTESNIYAWNQVEPNLNFAGAKIKTLNLNNMQYSEQDYMDSSTVCEAGTGS